MEITDVEMADVGMADVAGQKTRLKPIRADIARGISITGLRDYWEFPLIPHKMSGRCPNCFRVLRSQGAGLCHRCYALRGLRGLVLLRALAVEASVPEPLHHLIVDEVIPQAPAEDAAIVEEKMEDVEKQTSIGRRRSLVAMAEREMDVMLGILKSKNADYGGGDHMGNFKMAEQLGVSPFIGVLLRMGDKFSRIMSLARKDGAGQVPDESIEDTLRDLANYAIIAIVVRRICRGGA